MKSLGGAIPRSFAIFRRKGRQRHGTEFSAHLYTASRSIFRLVSFESHAAMSVPPPNSEINLPCAIARKVRIFFGFVKSPFSDDLTA